MPTTTPFPSTLGSAIDVFAPGVRDLSAFSAADIRGMKPAELKKIAKARNIPVTDDKGKALPSSSILEDVMKARLSESRQLGHTARKLWSAHLEQHGNDLTKAVSAVKALLKARETAPAATEA